MTSAKSGPANHRLTRTGDPDGAASDGPWCLKTNKICRDFPKIPGQSQGGGPAGRACSGMGGAVFGEGGRITARGFPGRHVGSVPTMQGIWAGGIGGHPRVWERIVARSGTAPANVSIADDAGWRPAGKDDVASGRINDHGIGTARASAAARSGHRHRDTPNRSVQCHHGRCRCPCRPDDGDPR